MRGQNPPKDGLTEAETRTALRTIIKDGVASQAMVTLTGGAFLVAFALKLGASNLVIGLLAGIPPLLQLLQIPSIYLVEKIQRRRAICATASLLSRLNWLGTALIPFLFQGEAAVAAFLGFVLLSGAFGAVSQCSWNSWMRDVVPQGVLGKFFSRRLRLGIGVGMVLSLLGALFIDYWEKWYPGREAYAYSVVFFLGFLLGATGVYLITTIPEPRMTPTTNGFFQAIRNPFRDGNFRRLLFFLAAWNFATNLAAPFFTVYMLNRLELDLLWVMAFLVLSQTMNIAFMSAWGLFADRFSHKSVLSVSAPLFIVCILAWSFTTLPERYFLTIPLLIVIHVLMGISTAGTTLASGTIGLKLAPKGEATFYLAATSIVNSLAAGIAPILGGRFADFFEARQLSMTFHWVSPQADLAFQALDFQHWDFFFLFAFLIGLFSLRLLAGVREAGEVEERIVFHELIAEVRRGMRNFSTAGGLRHMLHFPFSVVRRARNGQSRFTREERAA